MFRYLKYFLLFCILEFVIGLNGQSSQIKNERRFSQIEATALVDSLTDKCWALREKNSDSALIIGNQALDLALEYNLQKSLAKIYGAIGVVYIHYLYDTKKAIPYFHQSLKSSLLNDDSVQIAYTYNNLGDAFLKTGNIPLALQYSEQSLDIFSRLNHAKGIAYGYVNMGLVSYNEKKYHLALEYFEKAKVIREKIGDKTGLASVILEEAKVYQKEGHLEKSLSEYQNSLKKHTEINNTTYTAYCLNGIASVYYQKEQYDKAFEHFTKALELNSTKGHYYGLIDDHLGIALVYAQQNKIEEGEESLNKALKIANRLSLNSSILKSYETISKFYQIVNDYKKAAESFNRFLVLYDSILSIQQFEVLNEIENNFLTQENLNKTRQELATKNLEQKYLIVIIILMVITVLVILSRFISQNKMTKKLRESNNVKDKLFSVISHDLISPFTSLLGFSDLMMKDLKNDNFQNVKKYTEIIHQSATETLKQITNLLNWSRSQSGTIKYFPNSFSLKILLNEISEFFKIDSRKNNISIEFNCLIEGNIIGDKNILRIILTNLISNAIKYTSNGNTITINAFKSSSNIIIEVIDLGVGIPQKKLETLFSSSKLNKSTMGVRKEKGNGLGLTICNELIQLHKGNITVESILGKGSTFKIQIPNNTKAQKT